MAKQSTYEQVTARIIEELEKGAAPWVKRWRADGTADRNVISDKPYRGINRLLLGMSGYSSPHWGTFKQWLDKGGAVRKGEKATHIVFFKPISSMKETDEGESVNNQYCVLRGYCVFNADQVDGVELPAPVIDETQHERHTLAELTLKKSGAVIEHGGDAAFYSPARDFIKMPTLSSFENAPSYYATALHELTHWTGAKHRLDRDLDKGRYGNPAYAFEELVAEMGAAFLCSDHGIQGELRHAGYIQSWLKACRENDRAIFKAAALAQQAADYVMALAAAESEGERIAA